MDHSSVKNEMREVVTAARDRLAECSDVARGSEIIDSSKRELDRIAKVFRRKLDEKAAERPGRVRFAVNEKASLESRLVTYHHEYSKLLDALMMDGDCEQTRCQ